jgi:sulfopyruvate decarboxylase subunit beta
MIERIQAFSAIAEYITDELVVTGIASQTASWFQVKDRPENLYLRGPMGLAPALGLGVALAHPERKVVVIEGDGSPRRHCRKATRELYAHMHG